MIRQMSTTILTVAFIGACTKPPSFNFGQKSGETTSQNVSDAKGKNDKEEEELPELSLIEKAVTDHDIELAAGLMDGEEQMAKFCEDNKDKRNIVITKFCIEKLRPKSIIEFQQALNLVVPPNQAQGNIGNGGVPGYAMQGHSSSLVGQFVSAINPRVIIFNDQDPTSGVNARDSETFVAMGFVRGEQFAEVIVANLNEDGTPAMVPDNDGNPVKDISLFLVGFKQACNAREGGCNYGELLTDAVESNWTEFTIYSDEDLKNTIIDCRHCHQPEGLGTAKFGRMQELRNPWGHWMRNNRNNGTALIDDFEAAHGVGAGYGGVPGSSVTASDPNELENLMDANGFTQNQITDTQFDSGAIIGDVTGNNAAQPEDNTIPGESDTWEALFQLSAGAISADGRNIIPVPYHDVKVTEPSLLQKYTTQYQQFRAGQITMEQFEDHRDIFRTDQKQRADMGFAVRADASVQQTLIQACFQCHNGKLDQSISRAKFSLGTPGVGLNAVVGQPFQIDFAQMGDIAAAELDIAIERLRIGYSKERMKSEGIKFVSEDTREEVELKKGEHILTMPPRRFKQLTDTQIDAIIQFMEAEKAKLAK